MKLTNCREASGGQSPDRWDQMILWSRSQVSVSRIPSAKEKRGIYPKRVRALEMFKLPRRAYLTKSQEFITAYRAGRTRRIRRPRRTARTTERAGSWAGLECIL